MTREEELLKLNSKLLLELIDNLNCIRSTILNQVTKEEDLRESLIDEAINIANILFQKNVTKF
jgi:hypothetical protein